MKRADDANIGYLALMGKLLKIVENSRALSRDVSGATMNMD
jgi:hypothetical protein